MLEIYDHSDVLKHFIKITILNIFYLDTFFFEYAINMGYGYGFAYTDSRIIVFIILALLEQILLWISDIRLDEYERFWKFCFKILNPVLAIMMVFRFL